jgi:hypothetical protein
METLVLEKVEIAAELKDSRLIAPHLIWLRLFPNAMRLKFATSRETSKMFM